MTLALSAGAAAAQDCPGPGCPAIDPFADLGGFIDTLSAQMAPSVEGSIGGTRGAPLAANSAEATRGEAASLEGRLLLDVPFVPASAELSEASEQYVSRLCLGLWLADVGEVALTGWPTDGDADLSRARAVSVGRALSDACQLEPAAVVVRDADGALPSETLNVASGTLIELQPLP